MTRLEDELRNTFATNVAEVPSIHDVAGTAIARGRVVRRRRRITVGAAFAVVIAMVASGTLWAGGGVDGRPDRRPTGQLAAPAPSGAPNSAAAPTSSTPFDLLVGGELRPAGHAPIALPGSGYVFDALRAPEGWLIVRGAKGSPALWLVGPDGTAKSLIDALAGAYAFSADGRQIAYQQGNKLTVAALAGGKATVEHTTDLPGHDGNQGRTGAELVSWAGRYVVIGNRLGIDYDGFDVWDPSRGAYVPSWNHQVTRIHAATPDGRYLIGTVADSNPGSHCAAQLDPAARLRIVNKVCGQPALFAYTHGVSPDGRRILADSGGAVGVVDTGTGTVAATVPAAQASSWAEPVWVDKESFVIPEQDRILSVTAADPQHPRELPAPSTSERWLIVPRAGG